MVVIGIDFGTTNCYVAAVVNEKVEVLRNAHGKEATPSFVRFTDEKRVIGVEAEQRAVSDPKNTIYGIKRLLGREVQHPIVKKFTFDGAFPIITREKKLMIQATRYEKREFRPEELAAILIRQMKKLAESRLKDTVTGAVITIPPSFNEAQRNAILNSARIAGIDSLDVISETTAVAIAHRDECERQGRVSGRRHALIFHFGDGSTDVSVVRMQNNVIEVLSHSGAADVGGKDLDRNMIRYWIRKQKERGSFYNGVDDEVKAILRKEWAVAKHDLSLVPKKSQVAVHLPKSGRSFKEDINREIIEKENADLIDFVLRAIHVAVDDAKTPSGEIDDVVIVGGPARTLLALEGFQRRFSEFSKKRKKWVNEDVAAVKGAAILADQRSQKRMKRSRIDLRDFARRSTLSVNEERQIQIEQVAPVSECMQFMVGKEFNPASFFTKSLEPDEVARMRERMRHHDEKDAQEERYRFERNAIDTFANGWNEVNRRSKEIMKQSQHDSKWIASSQKRELLELRNIRERQQNDAQNMMSQIRSLLSQQAQMIAEFERNHDEVTKGQPQLAKETKSIPSRPPRSRDEMERCKQGELTETSLDWNFSSPPNTVGH